MNGARVCAAGTHGLRLHRNIVFFTERHRAAEIILRVNGTHIRKGNDCAAAHFARCVRRAHTGNIARRRALQHKRRIGLQNIRRRARAAQANLLLRGEDEIRVVFERALHQRDKRKAAHAVIERLRLHRTVHVLKERHKARVVANLHQCLGLLTCICADVDGEFVHGHGLFKFVALKQMHRLCADDTRRFAVHQHIAAGEHLRADIADRRELQKAVFHYVRDDKAHFVHVSAEHQLLLGTLFALFKRQNVAERRNVNLVRIRLNFT